MNYRGRHSNKRMTVLVMIWCEIRFWTLTSIVELVKLKFKVIPTTRAMSGGFSKTSDEADSDQ